MDTFGSRLKRLRTDAGLTQEEAAQKFGVARATWASWEIQRREPDHYVLIGIAKLFKVSVDSLLGVESVPSNPAPTPPPPPSNIKHLYDAVARAKDLPKEEADKVADILEILIEKHKQQSP